MHRSLQAERDTGCFLFYFCHTIGATVPRGQTRKYTIIHPIVNIPFFAHPTILTTKLNNPAHSPVFVPYIS